MSNVSAVGPLRDDIVAAGYFPEFISDTVERALAGEEIRAHFVHPETTLDNEHFMRHLTVLVLTPTRLLINHTDEAEARRSEFSSSAGAASTTESIPLRSITGAAVTRVCAHPERYNAQQPSAEAWLQLGWGIVHRVELLPAVCPDPTCDADHGLTGELTSDDLVIRVSEPADGADKVAGLEAFGLAVQQAIGQWR